MTRFYKILMHTGIIIAFFGVVSIVTAETAGGNGYVLEQTISQSSQELEGNGYSATQTITPVYGAMESAEYKSKAIKTTSPIPPSIVAPAVVTATPPTHTAGNSGFELDQIVTITTDNINNNFKLKEGDTGAVNELLKPFLTERGGFSQLYEDLGRTVKERSSGGSIVSVKSFTDSSSPIQVITSPVFAFVVVLFMVIAFTVAIFGYEHIKKIIAGIACFGGAFGFYRNPLAFQTIALLYDSKIVFLLITLLGVGLFFVAIGVAVFGYQRAQKVVAALVCLMGVSGVIFTSKIYLLPAFLGFIVLIIFFVKHKEHEVRPVRSALSP